MLSLASVDEMSQTVRTLYGVFTHQWDNLVTFFIKKLSKIYGETNKKLLANKTRQAQLRRNTTILEDVVSKVIKGNKEDGEINCQRVDQLEFLQESTKKSLKTFATTKNDIHGDRRKGRKSGEKVRNQGDIDFDQAMMDDDEILREESKKQKEHEMTVKVNKILAQMDDKEFFEKYDPEDEDPLTLLTLNERIHDDMATELRTNINSMNKYLMNSNSLNLNMENMVGPKLLEVNQNLQANRMKYDMGEKIGPGEGDITDEKMDKLINDIQKSMLNLLERKTKQILASVLNKHELIKQGMFESKGDMTELTSEMINTIEAECKKEYENDVKVVFEEEAKLLKDKISDIKVENNVLKSNIKELEDGKVKFISKIEGQKSQLNEQKSQMLLLDNSKAKDIKGKENEVSSANNRIAYLENELFRVKKELSNSINNQEADKGTVSLQQKFSQNIQDAYRLQSDHYQEAVKQMNAFEEAANIQSNIAYNSMIKIQKVKTKNRMLKAELDYYRNPQDNKSVLNKIDFKVRLEKGAKPKQLSFASYILPTFTEYQNNIKSLKLDDPEIYENCGLPKPILTLGELQTKPPVDPNSSNIEKSTKMMMDEFEQKMVNMSQRLISVRPDIEPIKITAEERHKINKQLTSQPFVDIPKDKPINPIDKTRAKRRASISLEKAPKNIYNTNDTRMKRASQDDTSPMKKTKAPIWPANSPIITDSGIAEIIESKKEDKKSDDSEDSSLDTERKQQEEIKRVDFMRKKLELTKKGSVASETVYGKITDVEIHGVNFEPTSSVNFEPKKVKVEAPKVIERPKPKMEDKEIQTQPLALSKPAKVEVPTKPESAKSPPKPRRFTIMTQTDPLSPAQPKQSPFPEIASSPDKPKKSSLLGLTKFKQIPKEPSPDKSIAENSVRNSMMDEIVLSPDHKITSNRIGATEFSNFLGDASNFDTNQSSIDNHNTSNIYNIECKLKLKERKAVDDLIKKYNKRMEDYETVVKLEDKRRDIIFKLAETFDKFKNKDIQTEFETFLMIMISSVTKKGSNFQSNDFVNYLLSEKSVAQKFMFAFGQGAGTSSKSFAKDKGEMSTKSGNSYMTNLLKKKTQLTMMTQEDNKGPDRCVYDPTILNCSSMDDQKLSSSIKFVNDVMLGKNEHAQNHVTTSMNSSDLHHHHKHHHLVSQEVGLLTYDNRSSTHLNNNKNRMKKYIKNMYEPSDILMDGDRQHRMNLNSGGLSQSKKRKFSVTDLNIREDIVEDSIVHLRERKESNVKALLTQVNSRSKSPGQKGSPPHYKPVAPVKVPNFKHMCHPKPPLTLNSSLTTGQIPKGHNKSSSYGYNLIDRRVFERNKLNLSSNMSSQNITQVNNQNSKKQLQNDQSLQSWKMDAHPAELISDSNMNIFDQVLEHSTEEALRMNRINFQNRQRKDGSSPQGEQLIKSALNPFYCENYLRDEFYLNLFACYKAIQLVGDKSAIKVNMR